MAVVEKPIETKIKLVVTNEYQEYEPDREVSCWVDIKLEAPIFEEDENKRAAVDLIAVIDRSGSMGGGKLDLVKKTLHFVLSQLAARDRLALIVYDNSIDVIFTLTRVTSENKGQLEASIDSVQTRDSTNLCGGLMKGMQMVIERKGEKAEVASVLLLTDGHANAGIQTKEGILEAMKNPFAPQHEKVDVSFQQLSYSNIAPPQLMQQMNQMPPQMQQQQQAPVQMQQQQQAPVQMQQQQQAPVQVQQQQQAPVQMQQQQQAPVQMQQQQQAPVQVQQQQQAPVQMQQQQQAPVQVQQLQAPPPPPPAPAPVSVPAMNPDTGASPLEPADIASPELPFEGTVYTFGFGNDHNASLLEEISNQGNGAYYYIDSQEKVPESFASCLGGLLSTVGQNISLVIELENGCAIKEFTAKNNPKYNEAKTRAEVALGDLQSEETRDVLMELTLPVSTGGAVRYSALSLSYFNVITAAMETVRMDLTVDRANTGKPRVSNPTIDKERNRLNITKAIKEARQKANEGKYKEGRDILSACEEKVKASVTAEDPLCKAMLIDLADCMRGMEDEQSYAGYGGQRMANISQNYKNQRANFVPDPAMCQNVMYQTTAQSAMMKKF